EEYLSYAGSSWAVMALLSALPESPAKVETPEAPASNSPAWLRTALFSTTQQLQALLDTGLDPNSKTRNGTSVLMASAWDVEKVRLLLSRGADAKTRASSGADALTIAAAYRGTAPSLQALLNAGADV